VDFSNYWRQGQNWDTGLPFLNGQKKPVLIATDQQQRHRKEGRTAKSSQLQIYAYLTVGRPEAVVD
jgi:hypothetical protein